MAVARRTRYDHTGGGPRAAACAIRCPAGSAARRCAVTAQHDDAGVGACEPCPGWRGDVSGVGLVDPPFGRHPDSPSRATIRGRMSSASSSGSTADPAVRPTENSWMCRTRTRPWAPWQLAGQFDPLGNVVPRVCGQQDGAAHGFSLGSARPRSGRLDVLIRQDGIRRLKGLRYPGPGSRRRSGSRGRSWPGCGSGPHWAEPEVPLSGPVAELRCWRPRVSSGRGR